MGYDRAAAGAAGKDDGVFRMTLDREIERVVLFLLREQGELASRLSSIRSRGELLAAAAAAKGEGPTAISTSPTNGDHGDDDELRIAVGHPATGGAAAVAAPSGDGDDVRTLAAECRDVGEEFLAFVHYVELNVVSTLARESQGLMILFARKEGTGKKRVTAMREDGLSTFSEPTQPHPSP